MRRFLIILAAWLWALPVSAAEFARAEKVGPAHGPGCGAGFTDLTGQCWSCPKGYRHDNLLLPPTHARVCKQAGRTDRRKGAEVGKSKLGYCNRGWLSTNNGNCYTCPKGYRHDRARFGNQKGVCYRKHKARYSAAARQQGSLLCNAGFFDPADGGSCWRCPKHAPNRTLSSVKSDKACRSLACGDEKSRPCRLTERIPSCNDGLVENFLEGRCVPAAHRAAICKSTVNALLAGRQLSGVSDLAKSALTRTHTRRKQLQTQSQRDRLLARLDAAIKPHLGMVPELKRLTRVLQLRQGKVRALFTAENLCERPEVLDHQLTNLGLRPRFMAAEASTTPLDWVISRANADDGHFFLGFQIGLAGGIGAGAHASLLFVTDFRGDNGSFASVGPQLVSNATVGTSAGVQFFPTADLADFIGGGLGVGVSGGPPSKAVGAGIDASFDGDLNFQGFGISGSIGLGVIPGDVAIAGSHGWQL